ncbi:MAG: uroporphyrinogen-III C-methyltransferase [Phycisphaeraceae bacterium]
MTRDTAKTRGRVVLVGAGPGAPGLITWAGLEALRLADVVVYDALANAALLAQAPPDAERIDVGKRAGHHRLTQEAINALLVDKAREGGGKRVVRLKGGDPYLFGRGAEEAAHVGAAGIACEVIPGVTSGIAAPAMAGIPVTHRAHASTVTFVTGHEEAGKPGSSVDYSALARLIAAGGTACFYMAMGRWDTIASALIDAGLPASTPAAAVQWGTLPQQRSARATLAGLAAAVSQARLGPPAIVVVGAVAGMDDQTAGALNWFERRPLFGRTVLVTRSRTQASQLAHDLAELGAATIEAPTIELVPPADWTAMDAAVRRLADATYDWLVLTSGHAVAALAERLDAAGLDARALGGVRIAAVGAAPAEALRQRVGVRADLVPDRQLGAVLGQALVDRGEVAGKRFLLPRAGLAGRDLPTILTDAGGEVEEVAAYETRQAAALPEDAISALEAGRVDWVTFTSSSTARHFTDLLGERREPLMRGVRTASIGPTTSATMRELGLSVDVEVQPPDPDEVGVAGAVGVAGVAGLMAAIVAAEGG